MQHCKKMCIQTTKLGSKSCTLITDEARGYDLTFKLPLYCFNRLDLLFNTESSQIGEGAYIMITCLLVGPNTFLTCGDWWTWNTESMTVVRGELKFLEKTYPYINLSTVWDGLAFCKSTLKLFQWTQRSQCVR